MDNNQQRVSITIPAACLFTVNTGAVFPEEQADAPKTRQGDDRVDDSTEDSILPAEDP